jgi:hypothetical protein
MSRFSKAVKKAANPVKAVAAVVPKIVAPVKKVSVAVKDLGNAAIKPVTRIIENPKLLVQPKALLQSNIKDGRKIGQGLEAAVVSINPLDHTLQKFDEKGKKAGGIGTFFGRIGEKARTRPIATTAIVYGAVLAAGAALAGGGSSAAAGGGVVGAEAGVTTAATATSLSTYTGYAGTAYKAYGKVTKALNAPKDAAAAQAEAQARAAAEARAQSGQMGFFERIVHAIFG